MSPTTIYEAFKESIPKCKQPPEQTDVYESSAGATNATEPTCLLSIPVQFWLDAAEKVLKEGKEKLKTKYVATQGHLRLETEGDVVHATAVALNQPVHAALYAYGSERIFCVAECHVKNNTKARVDMAYFADIKTEDSCPFAVVEYKSWNAIVPGQFKNAKIKSKADNVQIFNEWQESRFYSASQTLMKQAVFYSSHYETPYVALWDMQTLVLIYFEDMEFGVESPDGGPRCLATVVTERERIRKALLGFLVTAYQERDTKNGPKLPKGYEKPENSSLPSRTQPSRAGKAVGYSEYQWPEDPQTLGLENLSLSSQTAGEASSASQREWVMLKEIERVEDTQAGEKVILYKFKAKDTGAEVTIPERNWTRSWFQEYNCYAYWCNIGDKYCYIYYEDKKASK